MIMLSLLPPPPVFFCRCSCGKLALVLASSGAARPFAWCSWCGVSFAAPPRSRWEPRRQVAAAQLSLFQEV